MHGVSINGIFGQESVINQAKKAASETNNRQEEEAMNVKIMQALGKGSLTEEGLKQALDGLISGEVTQNGDGTWTVTGESGVEYTIDSDGVVAPTGKYNEVKPGGGSGSTGTGGGSQGGTGGDQGGTGQTGGNTETEPKRRA